MNIKEHASHLIERLGVSRALDSCNYALDIWLIKSKYPDIHGKDICKKTINYYNKLKILINETKTNKRTNTRI